MISTLMLTTCNLLSGAGLDKGFMGEWSKGFLGVLILFFVFAFARRWVFEAIDQPFNLIVGEALGIISYIVVINLTCSSKIALLVGLGIGAIGGWIAGGFLGGGGGD